MYDLKKNFKIRFTAVSEKTQSSYPDSFTRFHFLFRVSSQLSPFFKIICTGKKIISRYVKT